MMHDVRAMILIALGRGEGLDENDGNRSSMRDLTEWIDW
jgi:hypothetical protein